MDEIFTLMAPDGTIQELKVTPLAPPGIEKTILCRHRTPGHMIEDGWFIMNSALKLGKTDAIAKAAGIIKKAFDIGWDDVHGGLLRFVDEDGGKPKGTTNNDSYEKLIEETWDMKIWWPHAEALWASLFAHDITHDDAFAKIYQKVHDYVFHTFPNPDNSVGEWIQIRDRKGVPIEKLVALPVKDPYHILRCVLLIIDHLYAQSGQKM